MNPLDKLSSYKIVLASKSPRRQQLLADLGLTFTIRTLDVDESFPTDMAVPEIPSFLAEKKASAFLGSLHPDELLITADTIVAQGEQVLNKPADAADARRMLQLLSGKKHQVLTGVCICTTTKRCVFTTSTDVWFKELSGDEIDYYIANYKPFDKAGAYGIQEWIGYVGIYRIDGSYFNVMGLPVQQLYEHLLQF